MNSGPAIRILFIIYTHHLSGDVHYELQFIKIQILAAHVNYYDRHWRIMSRQPDQSFDSIAGAQCNEYVQSDWLHNVNMNSGPANIWYTIADS